VSSIIKWLKDVFKRHDLIVVFTISTLVGLSLYAYPHTRDFGVNFITELVSVWVTVFLVNRIIEKRERKRRLSIDQRILKETSSIIASYFSIWKHLVWRYFPEAKINSEQDLLARYEDILNAAHLSEKFEVVSIHDPESWKLFFHNRTIKECFENYYEALQGDIRSLIDNFKIHLEPELLGYLLEMNESKYLREVNSVFRNDEADVLNEFGQDINKLSSYISNDKTHFNKIRELSLYCVGLNDRISEFADSDLKLYNFKTYFRNPMVAYAAVNQVS
jgi:hypothetical protein